MTNEILINRKKEQGFTLVELAIVMIIIGLLIGGILKGQEMIENAKVTSTIAQIKSFQAALNSFRDTYSGMPGDMRNATTRVPNCVAATNCINGNGNGLIGQANPNINNVIVDDTAGSGQETTMAWKHLVLANLISSVPSDTVSTAATAAFGDTHPASSLRGGYEIFYDADPVTDNTNWTPISGHFLRLSNVGLTANTGAVQGTAPVSPLRGSQIDRKLDDGRANSGSTLAAGTGCTATPTGGTVNDYDGTVEQKNCVMFFLIDG
jgi:prepilin-type N-terminal cleavage/methylation domain-containing protein